MIIMIITYQWYNIGSWYSDKWLSDVMVYYDGLCFNGIVLYTVCIYIYQGQVDGQVDWQWYYTMEYKVFCLIMHDLHMIMVMI